MKSINFTTILLTFLVTGLIILNQSCDATRLIKKIEISDFANDKIAGEKELDFLYNGLRTGENIKLKKLVYYLDRPLMVSSKNDFTLDGNGCTFIMKDKFEDVLVVENSKNITLKNFKATHIEPEGPIGCTGSVIQVRYNDGVLIEKCALNGSGIIGVVSYGTKNLRVVDNFIYNNSDYGILYDGETSIEITGNNFEDNGTSGNDHVVKTLNSWLSEIEQIKKNINKEGLKMSNNIFN
jgi:hypothetical protein